MSQFMEMVFSVLQRGLILAFLAGFAAAALVGLIYAVHRRRHGDTPFPWKTVLLRLMAAGYLLIVLYVTMFRWTGGYRQWNLHLFRAWREAWNHFSVKSWGNVLLNIGLFLPMGFLPPLMWRKFRKWYVTIPVCVGASATIELMQLALNCGVCDVDDLFCNSLGAAVGYLAVMAFYSLFGEKRKGIRQALGYLGLALLPVVVIGGLFGAYHIREYGNLREAATYRVDLDHLQWEMACTLPEHPEQVPVYRAQTMDRSECDAFAQGMASMSGQSVLMVSYYEEMAYYNLSEGYLLVNYDDGSYEYNCADFDEEPGAASDRRTVEKALRRFSVMIPGAASFQPEEDGWYSFQCDKYADGSAMFDGTLKVQLSSDGTVCQIKNGLVSYTYYKSTPVISPEDAHKKLKRGEFLYADALKRDACDAVTVRSCVLDYQIDTKGFYQPVYLFEVLIPETGNLCIGMIPALG